MDPSRPLLDQPVMLACQFHYIGGMGQDMRKQAFCSLTTGDIHGLSTWSCLEYSPRLQAPITKILLARSWHGKGTRGLGERLMGLKRMRSDGVASKCGVGVVLSSHLVSWINVHVIFAHESTHRCYIRCLKKSPGMKERKKFTVKDQYRLINSDM